MVERGGEVGFDLSYAIRRSSRALVIPYMKNQINMPMEGTRVGISKER